MALTDKRGTAAWKPISELTEEEFETAYDDCRLMLWNSCNSPHHSNPFADYYCSAGMVKAEEVWEKYLILPEAS